MNLEIISDIWVPVATVVTATYAAVRANAIAQRQKEISEKQFEAEQVPMPKLDFVVTANWDEQQGKMAGYNCVVVNYGKAPAILYMPRKHESVHQYTGVEDDAFLPQNPDRGNKNNKSYNNCIETFGHNHMRKQLDAGTRPETFWNSVIVQPQQSVTFFRGTTHLNEIVRGRFQDDQKPLYFHLHESHQNIDYPLRLEATDNDGLTLINAKENPFVRIADSEMDDSQYFDTLSCKVYKKLEAYQQKYKDEQISIFSGVRPDPNANNRLDFVVTSLRGVEAVSIDFSHEPPASLDGLIGKECATASKLHNALEEIKNISVHRTIWTPNPNIAAIAEQHKDDKFLSIKSFTDDFEQVTKSKALDQATLKAINTTLSNLDSSRRSAKLSSNNK